MSQLTDCQGRLSAYIRTLVVDPDVAKDILQETNLVLWRKADEFAEGTNFGAWASKIAHFQVLAYRRDQGRERLRFNDDLLGRLASTAVARQDSFDDRQQAMRNCMTNLEPEQREIVQAKYQGSHSIAHLAGRFERSHESIKKILFRARKALLRCIERKLAEERRP